jgi:hypothetical protein
VIRNPADLLAYITRCIEADDFGDVAGIEDFPDDEPNTAYLRLGDGAHLRLIVQAVMPADRHGGLGAGVEAPPMVAPDHPWGTPQGPVSAALQAEQHPTPKRAKRSPRCTVASLEVMAAARAGVVTTALRNRLLMLIATAPGEHGLDAILALLCTNPKERHVVNAALSELLADQKIRLDSGARWRPMLRELPSLHPSHEIMMVEPERAERCCRWCAMDRENPKIGQPCPESDDAGEPPASAGACAHLSATPDGQGAATCDGCGLRVVGHLTDPALVCIPPEEGGPMVPGVVWSPAPEHRIAAAQQRRFVNAMLARDSGPTPPFVGVTHWQPAEHREGAALVTVPPPIGDRGDALLRSLFAKGPRRPGEIAGSDRAVLRRMLAQGYVSARDGCVHVAALGYVPLLRAILAGWRKVEVVEAPRKRRGRKTKR